MSARGHIPPLETLRKRREFLHAARARRCASPGLVVQMAKRPVPDATAEARIGVGFTASRKVGNAVARNRAKRRMRALARSVLPALGRPGHNYVLIARQALLNRTYDDLKQDLAGCLARLEKGAAGRSGPARRMAGVER